MSKMAASVGCQVCGKQLSVLKRCTRCRHVFYCSRDCQVSDWPLHKTQCGRHLPDCPPGGATAVSECRTSSAVVGHGLRARRATRDIWGDEGGLTESTHRTNHTEAEPIRTEGRIGCTFTPRIDFEGAKKSLEEKKNEKAGTLAKANENCVTYLCRNAVCTDAPVVDELQPKTQITVKGNKERHKIVVNLAWSWEQVAKVLSHYTEIPLDKLKLIAKGKLITSTEVFWAAASQPKVVFQAIGEKGEWEDGLEGIDIIMRQMGVERNAAIRALKHSSGDVVDAILHLGGR